MSMPSSPSALLLAAPLLLALGAAAACGASSTPPESPEKSDKTEGADKPSSPEADIPKDPAAPADEGTVAAAPSARKIDPALSLDTYEMTPSDCNALGQHYGEVARSDQMSALSPKLKEAQRASTAAQVDKVVGKLEETWISGCQTSLVNKAVDHDGIKCALAAKTVKDFDVCLNGASGTPQPSGKKKK
jgi:hypothetical protein